MYNVWNDNVKLPNIAELKTLKSKSVTIKPFEPENDGYIFLHGVSLVRFGGRLYCAWAHNKVKENSGDEEVNFAVSDDGGMTWSSPIKGNLAPKDGMAVSHGVMLVHEGNLYYFAPHFKGHCGKEMMKTGAYLLDEGTQSFKYIGVALDGRFWPTCEPILMDNGNYVMPGLTVEPDFASADCINANPAVAISRGSDVLHWNMVEIDGGERAWGECSIIVNGSNLRMYCRDATDSLKALYAESNDFGESWSELRISNMPMVNSKPYSGLLSSGQGYLICSSAADIRDRNPLTIAVTDKGSGVFNRIYAIAKGDKGHALSYPYAIEIDKKLYVAYSYTKEGYSRNSAELAIIDIEDLM